MSDVTANYGTLRILLRFLGIFTPNCRPFMSELWYFHQTFPDYVSDLCTHFL